MTRDVTKPRGPPIDGAEDVTRKDPNDTWDRMLSDRARELMGNGAKLDKATLETTDIDFLRAATEETWFVHKKGLGPQAMTSTQRKQKERLVKRLAAGYLNADLVFEPYHNWRFQNHDPGWFNREDIQRVIPPSSLYRLLTDLVLYGGPEYRKALREFAMSNLGSSPWGGGWRIQFVRDDWPEDDTR